MKKKIAMALIALATAYSATAQTNDKPAVIVETTYMLPKHGMEEKFEAAVKAHNEKFHPAGAHVAGLRSVDYGDMAGWYVWVMGPTEYSALDNQLGKTGGHDDDWNKTVDIYVDKYQAPVIYQYEPDYSFGMDIWKKSKHFEVWKVSIKSGQGTHFKALLAKLHKTYESMGNRAFMVYSNPLHTANSADYGLVWSFTSYDDWGKDWKIKEGFEKIYGEGSWQLALDEWNSIVENYSSEIRSFK